jgi:hypothetical protein
MNSFLVGSEILLNENFILPKSLHLCLIRFEEGYGVEGEEAKLQPEQEGATTGKKARFPYRGRELPQGSGREFTVATVLRELVL